MVSTKAMSHLFCICMAMLFSAVCSERLQAQTPVGAEAIFRQARSRAFDDKDYPGAILLCKQAVQLSPGDPDYLTFLGRLYAWTHQYDSAGQAFDLALAGHPDYEDGFIAYADLEIWNEHPARALEICMAGLHFHPLSASLLQRRATTLANLHRYKEAKATADSILHMDSRNVAVRSLEDRLRDYAADNKMGISYDYVYFDRQYKDPWHLLSVDYTRQTSIGPVIGRINYANRFRTNGVQFEAESYPHLSRMFYGYLEAGYSADRTIFPQYRAGGSLYANLPHAFEADAGVRWLDFGNDIWLYTFSIGKYYKNFWFNARTYLVPGESMVSQSVTLTSRYYYGTADDYFNIALGTGISPDDPGNNLQLASRVRLRSEKAEGGWRHVFHRLNIFFVDVQWFYQEYLPGISGNQIDVGVGYLRRF